MRGRKLCYYCGRQAVSKEHTPPRIFFNGFECDSITVPSCEEHNHEKGVSDQAIVNSLLIPLYSGRARHPLEPDVEKAIGHALPSFEKETKNVVIQTPLLENPPSELQDLPDVAYLTSSIDWPLWLRHMTAALVHNIVGNDSFSILWSRARCWSPDWFQRRTLTPLTFDQAFRITSENHREEERLSGVAWESGWSAYPRGYPELIYYFQVRFEGQNSVFFRRVFFGKYKMYVHFETPRRIINKLKEHAELYKQRRARGPRQKQ